MKRTFLTGATGFVGGQVLRRLVEEGTPAICLVRAESAERARERGLSTMAALGIGRAAPVEWVAGDVEREDLGLDAATTERLAGEIDTVFHCAASTEFDLPFEEAHRINVDGTARVMELAVRAHRAAGLRRFVHVSTAYASGKQRKLTAAETLPPDEPERFRNTYERTKALAERHLKRVADREGVPLTILRPSIIVGDSKTGWTNNWNVLYFPMRLVAWRKTPFLSCGWRDWLDCVPVDFVADATLALGRRKDTVGRTLHITAGDEVTTVREIYQLTCDGVRRREGETAKIRTWLIGPLLFGLATMLLRLFGSAAIRKGLANLGCYVDYTRVPSRFETMRESELLLEEGLACPPRTEFLPRVVEFALRENFGRPVRGAERPKLKRISVVEALTSATGTIADAIRKPGVSGVQAPGGIPA